MRLCVSVYYRICLGVKIVFNSRCQTEYEDSVTRNRNISYTPIKIGIPLGTRLPSNGTEFNHTESPKMQCHRSQYSTTENAETFSWTLAILRHFHE